MKFTHSAVLKRLLICLMIVLTTVLAFSVTAYADDDNNNNANNGKVEYVTSGALKDQLNDALNDLTGTSGFGANVRANAILASGSTLRKVWIDNQNLIKQIYNGFFAVGMSLSVAYFFVYLTHETTAGHWSTDSLIRALMMLVAAVGLMANGYKLIDLFIDLGASLGQIIIDVMGNGNGPVPIVDEDFVTRINTNTGLIPRAFAFVQLFVPSLIMKACYLYIQVVCYMRMLELVMKAFFMPIAIGDIYSGPNPSAIRYIKSFLATCLQGVIIVGGLAGYSMLGSAVATEVKGLGFFANIVLVFALVGVVGKSSSMAKEIVGA